MKFVELKKSLDIKVKRAYLLTGNDRFLCYNALEIIKKKLNLSFPDLNSVTFNEENFDESKIVEACEVLPFGDKIRLVIVKEFSSVKTPSDKLIKYLDSPVDSTVLVFFAPDMTEFLKKIESKFEKIDCDVLDDNLLSAWIVNFLRKRKVSIEKTALSALIEYTSSKLTRISSELEKLASFVGEGGCITKNDIDIFVYKDKDYQIYELNEAVANGNGEVVLDMLYSLLDTYNNEFYIITPLYNYFRRLLFIKTSNKTDFELSRMFKVKEFAVKKMREKVNYYTARNLKKAVDILSNSDLNIKSGKMSSDVAVKTAVMQIIKLRNK